MAMNRPLGHWAAYQHDAPWWAKTVDGHRYPTPAGRGSPIVATHWRASAHRCSTVSGTVVGGEVVVVVVGGGPALPATAEGGVSRLANAREAAMATTTRS